MATVQKADNIPWVERLQLCVNWVKALDMNDLIKTWTPIILGIGFMYSMLQVHEYRLNDVGRSLNEIKAELAEIKLSIARLPK